MNPVTPDRFLGFPVNAFAISERRSLTVHLEDAGKFNVFAAGDTNGGPSFAGRFDTFGEAQTVADGLNRAWRTAPQATASEVIGFVTQREARLLAVLVRLVEAEYASIDRFSAVEIDRLEAAMKAAREIVAEVQP